jgi:hypothetical protein
MQKIAFIHIPKTAGISMERALEMKRYRHLYSMREPVNETGLISFGHNKYESLISFEFTRDFMNGAFTFAFVRNPYDRMVSMYFYSKKVKKVNDISFEEFCQVAPTIRNVDFTQTSWVAPGVNFIGKFENLQDDFNTLCDILKVNRKTLKKINDSKKRKHWTEYYTKKTEEMVYHHYREDFINFNYERYNLLHQ